MSKKLEDLPYIDRGYKNESHFLKGLSTTFRVPLEKVQEFFQQFSTDLDELIDAVSLYSESLNFDYEEN